MIACERYKSVNKGVLLGFADIYVEKWGVEIKGCSLCMKDGRRWVNLPSRKYVDDEQQEKFAPIVRFKDRNLERAFGEKVKEAIDEWCKKEEGADGEQEPEFDDSECPF